MFVQSEEFVQAHGGRLADLTIYGQESNQTAWRLCKMNLAIRHIESRMVAWNNEGSFHNDAHKDLKAEFVMANPPFNDSDWGGDRLTEDKRWKYGVPPKGNANFAWVQHFISHLAPTGMAGFVLANGSMSSNQSGEGEIRKSIIEAGLVDCMIALPGQLFYSTQIPVCLWFIARDKHGRPSPQPLSQWEREAQNKQQDGRPSPQPLSQWEREAQNKQQDGRPSPLPLPKGEGETGCQYRGGYDFSGLVKRARELRKKQTPAEEVMWQMLRDRRFLGLKFRRQHQIGDYIADYYCDEKKLVVELDGPIHGSTERKNHDAKRDAWLKTYGLTVVRITNDAVLTDTEETLDRIAQAAVPSTSGRGIQGEGYRDRRGEVLFVDARELGSMVDRTHRELTDSDIARIARTYHLWKCAQPSPPTPLPRGEGGKGKGRAALGDGSSPSGRGEGEGDVYQDILGFCKSATLDEIRAHNHILTPGRYVGAKPQEEDPEPFPDKMARLTKQLEQQFAESARLEKGIRKNLKGLGYGG